MRAQREQQGQIDSRVLVNYRVELSVLRERLPAPFRPRSLHGYGVAGLDVFRLAARSRWSRRGDLLAVHRIEAVAQFGGQRIPGTYVLRCDVPPGLYVHPFGRFFPNVMHTARLQWDTPEPDRYRLRMGRRNRPWLEVQAHAGQRFPFDSMMEDLETASAFFGASEAWFAPRFGLTLFEQRRWAFSPWQVHPMLIERLDAPFFRRVMRFPKGSYFFDHALIQHDLRYRLTAPVELIAPRPVRRLFRDS